MDDIWKERKLYFSFLGMAPIDDPELIVYLAIKQPKLKGDEYGAQPLAEIFKPVMKNSLEYLKVKPYTENKWQMRRNNLK